MSASPHGDRPRSEFPLDGFLRDLLECVAEGVVAADLQGRFILFNSSAERVLGFGLLDIPMAQWTMTYGCFLEDGTTPYPPEELPLARALRGESVSNCVIHIRNGQTPDGRWINANARPLRDEGGRLYGGVIVFRDVTDERRELDRIRLLSAVTEQTADAVIVTDRSGVIEYVNPAVEKLTGYSSAEVIGKTPRLFKSGLHTKAEYAEMWDMLLRGEVFRGTLVNRKKDSGELFYSQQTITPIRDSTGRISRFVSIAKDLTDVRRSLELTHKLRLARLVQQRMYPEPPPAASGFDVAGAALPADETGGDYFDFLTLPGGSLGLAVGDVSGHGFDSALHMVQARAFLRTVIRSSSDPGSVLNEMNQLLLDELGDNRFITLVLACLNPWSGRLRYASAGHTTGILIDASGRVKAELGSTGMPLGLFPGARFDSVETGPLEEGDVLALMTDGVTESAGEEADIGTDWILDHLMRHRDKPAADIVDAICRAAREFVVGPQRDDITVVICKPGRRTTVDDGAYW
jgi:PAS domain S-box-containing protein